MSDGSRTRTGQVAATPEGGPINEGAPASVPGSGQVRLTPEAGPPATHAGEQLVPPTLRDHMQGPILGLDDMSPPPTAPAGEATAPRTREPEPEAAQDETELRKWPPYTGKPVSEVRWDALRYAAPLVSQAEKVTIRAIGLSGQGLSRLARYLEARRAQRQAADERGVDEGP